MSQWLAQCCETDKNEISFRGEMQTKMAALQVQAQLTPQYPLTHTLSLLTTTGRTIEGFGSAGEGPFLTDGQVSLESAHKHTATVTPYLILLLSGDRNYT